ncbi:Siderophore iron transporter mirB [Lasiodiplodia theobromae]|uniref:Siderophore iron transporter mirB n=1 Tax=Lasiodiplodia theobromae TaxID=45133 RepID=A0A5N5D0W7_9PEZI|nr:Siderophore iron transporter mirB [Lasiodiplodia theobromae]
MSAPPEISDDKGTRAPLAADQKHPQEHVVDAETSSDEESVRIQDGVKRVEAITQAWTMKALFITGIFIYICSFVNSLQQQITTNLGVYVTSSFMLHSLYSTTSVLSSVIGGVSKFPIAKIIDIWGRVEGFILMTFLCTIGLIMMAACKNVETYAAAQVFYWVGYNGMGYVINIFLADMTSLRNRMIFYGLNSTPFIANVFAGPAIAQLFYEHSSFRWAFGCFAIIVPFIAAPVAGMFMYNNNVAKKKGLLPPRPASGRTLGQSFYYYAREFDLIGQLLLIAGLCLVLIPLTLAGSAVNRWGTGYIIAMLVVGFVLLVVFVLYERFLAPVTFMPYKYMKDRTVFGACVLCGTLFLSFYCWDLYFSSYLQVVHNLNIRDSGYILNIYSLGSCFWGPFVGILIRISGRFKWLALLAVPVSTLATALLIYFRHPGTNIGYVVMCQILSAFAGGTLVMCEQLAAMAAVPHNEVAAVLALEGMFTSIGGSIGQSISGAIWTNMMPQKMLEYLPESEKANAAMIYGSLPMQLAFPVGSPARDAIIAAYGYVQRRMLIAGVAFMPVALGCVLLWRDINVKKLQQTKGNVF